MEGKYLLALNAHPKIGSQTLKKILAAFESGEIAWQASAGELKVKLDEKIANLVLETRALTTPEKEIEKLAKANIGYITIYDKNYPVLLKELYDAPVVLYIRGSVEALNRSGIGVVGSRKYSRYGEKVCYDLTKECASVGLAIVSGLALGIDAFAHRAAVDAGQVTVGVLGCGVDEIYPVTNSQLGREMIEKGGAIISEFPPGTAPTKYNFPTRNRIIAGLTLGVLVVEAAEQSGALITAYQSLEYNREVFAVPGNIDSPSSVGCNKLIKQGATPVTEAADIFKALNLQSDNKVKLVQAEPETDEERLICGVLESGEKIVDEIIVATGLNIIALSSAITMLEMKNLIKNNGGGRYKLNRKP